MQDNELTSVRLKAGMIFSNGIDDGPVLNTECGGPTQTLSTQEVARFLGMSSIESVVRRVQSGELPAVREGRELRFSLADVENYARVLHSTRL